MNDTTTTPFSTASMSAPEMYTLRLAGYEPIGVVIGAAAISMGTRGFGRSIRAIFTKGEMATVSQTSSEARRMALKRAEEEAQKMGADRLLISDWAVRDLAEVVEVTCTGTALRRIGELILMPVATATS